MALRIYSTIETDGPYPAVNAADVEMPDGKRLSEVDFSGGGSGGSVDVDEILQAVAELVFDENGKIRDQFLPEEEKPTNIDLTQYATDGVIVEHYADGSTVTHTIEFNSDGKPVKVTTDGVTTTLEW